MKKQKLGGALLDILPFDGAVSKIMSLARDETCCSIVVTPNIQHIALLESNSTFRTAYSSSQLVLADGWPVARAAGILARRRVPRVAGADLLPALLELAEKESRTVAVLGGPVGNETATERLLRQDFPTLKLVQVSSPPLGSPSQMRDGDLADLLAPRSLAHADLLFMFLGTPKQEVLAYRARELLNANVVLCIGASLDFLLGHQRRAPLLIRQLGLEWAYRIWRDPRRLAKRYAIAFVPFLRVVARDIRRRNAGLSEGRLGEL